MTSPGRKMAAVHQGITSRPGDNSLVRDLHTHYTHYTHTAHYTHNTHTTHTHYTHNILYI